MRTRPDLILRFLLVSLSFYFCILLTACSTSALCGDCGDGGLHPDGNHPVDGFVPIDTWIFTFDVAPPPDMAVGICPGTPVAGTCAAAFFTELLACFPDNGTCVVQSGSMTAASACWSDGGRLDVQVNADMTGAARWSAHGLTCLKATIKPDGQGGNVFDYFAPGGSTLTYDDATGEATCDDGETVNIGAMGTSCTALQRAIEPMECTQMGTCP
jgi:hypothetical protein